MNKRLVGFMLLSTLLIVGIIFVSIRQNQQGLLTLEGQITQIRMKQLADAATLVIIDFEMKNPSDVDFEVRSAGMAAMQQDAVADADLLNKKQAGDYLDYEKMAQPHPLFGAGDVVKSGTEAGGVMVGRFETVPAQLQDKTFRVQFTSANGVVVQLVGKP